MAYTFIFDDGQVVTIKADTVKQAMDVFEEKWYQGKFDNCNFKVYKNSGFKI